MTPQDFIAKWRLVNLTERSACQQHFLDLCDLLAQPKPAAADPEGAWYTFERGVSKTGGGQGWADVWMRGHFGWEYKGKHKDLTAAYRQLLLYREDLENPPLLVVCFMGVLHSRPHELWSRAQGTQVRERESGFRYTPTTCFETFPFPQPTNEQSAAIAEATNELDQLRTDWLNPPEWTREEVLTFPGSVDGPWARYVESPDSRGIGTVHYRRLAPLDAGCAKELAKRTLTNLYNQRPTWLANAHRRLDEAVFAAYGWPADLTDDEILAKLLELNFSRQPAA